MVSQKKNDEIFFCVNKFLQRREGIREDEKVSAAERGSILQCWIADELKNYK